MKQVTSILILLLISFISLRGQVPDSMKFRSLGPYDFHLQYLKDDSALLIDVREYFEIRKSRIKEAFYLPSSEGYDIASDTIDKRCSLFFYCYSGGRSKKAALYFYDKGFRKLYSLEGGIVAWKKDGFPVVKGKKKKRA
jgi:rhodanese-related sulfurtransferase